MLTAGRISLSGGTGLTFRDSGSLSAWNSSRRCVLNLVAVGYETDASKPHHYLGASSRGFCSMRTRLSLALLGLHPVPG